MVHEKPNKWFISRLQFISISGSSNGRVQIVVSLFQMPVWLQIFPSTTAFDSHISKPGSKHNVKSTIVNTYSAIYLEHFKTAGEDVFKICCTSRYIPRCACPLSHNAPFRTKMCTFLFWVVHCRIRDRRIMAVLAFAGWVIRASTAVMLIVGWWVLTLAFQYI